MREPDSPSGWHLVAFVDELLDDVTPAVVGKRRLIICRGSDRFHVFDGTCPHQGADLGVQSRVTPTGIICGFHGKLLRYSPSDSGLCLTEHATEQIGELLFVRIGPLTTEDRGFSAWAQTMRVTHSAVAGVRRTVRTPASVVVQNAFDIAHFSPVHDVLRALPVGYGRNQDGAPWVRAVFQIPMLSNDELTVVNTPFFARAFSPWVVVSEIRFRDQTVHVLTGATSGLGVSTVRIGFLFDSSGGSTDDDREQLTLDSAKSLDQDVWFWESLDHSVSRLGGGDEALTSFLRFRDECFETAQT